MPALTCATVGEHMLDRDRRWSVETPATVGGDDPEPQPSTDGSDSMSMWKKDAEAAAGGDGEPEVMEDAWVAPAGEEEKRGDKRRSHLQCPFAPSKLTRSRYSERAKARKRGKASSDATKTPTKAKKAKKQQKTPTAPAKPGKRKQSSAVPDGLEHAALLLLIHFENF
ncbi:hypothetical protein EJ03DRAFT_367766 [Teratosphaeria nubilosa]|uniref:Uncharacterized protein n=1 Tax=Teratosphaeria nubilosa TaxID=161662 RepID=A0A6G1KZR2_9PEZI|nr:hypothetical protein EJ03DRAFT_367766 [Teratosphaeria nubilosa]